MITIRTQEGFQIDSKIRQWQCGSETDWYIYEYSPHIILGTYASKERCLQILDEIWERIKYEEEWEHDGKTARILSKFYEMPDK